MNEVDPYRHEEQEKRRTRLIAYVGSYGVGAPVVGGGISVEVS